MKCQHKSLSITQNMTASRYHALDTDGNWCSWEQMQGTTGMITVSCESCGYYKTFNKYKVPKWVSEILIELDIIDE